VTRLTARALAMAGGLALGAVVLAEGTGSPAVQAEPFTLELKHGGLRRTALVYVPSNYDGSRALPLVLSFHGRYGLGIDQAQLTELHVIGQREGFMVVYPDGIARSWNALHGVGEAQLYNVDDVGFVDALILRLSERFRVDPDRVYASGMSNGGFFTHRLGCERSSRFAAIASVAGQMGTALEPVCRPSDPVPLLAFHGTHDPIVPYLGGNMFDGGSTLSAPRSVEVWAWSNGSVGYPRETLRAGQVICHVIDDGRAPATLCSVEGGGHTWPGGGEYASAAVVGPTTRHVNASEMIWQFFAANPRMAKKPAASPPSNLRIRPIR
jgi:polyhydroxybutyrate depolymerase